MGVGTIDQLRQLFARHRVDAILIKPLAPKQDNDKNQIYLGSGLDGVTQIFPARIAARSASLSTKKRASSVGRPKIEASIDLAWLDGNGALSKAPNARIIDYFQYPEVRLSGFLNGCDSPPDSLRRTRQALYGRRILALGVTPTGTVLGRVLTERDDPLVAKFPDLPELPAARIFRVLPVGGPSGSTPLDLLRAELGSIVEGWHSSVILKPGAGAPIPFRGPQGAGLTLEALLGIAKDARKAPDKHGYEIKSFAGSRISLMTPAPDEGFQGEHSFRDFMARYGRDGQKGDGSRRFTGLYKCGMATNGLELKVRGYDPASDTFGAPSGISVDLQDLASGDIVARWSLERLANSWNSKHASALYIPYIRRPAAGGSHDYEYQYGSKALVGEGTDVWRLLRAIHKGMVFYDPAHSIYPDGTAKVRPQWRVNSASLPTTAKALYASSFELKLGGP